MDRFFDRLAVTGSQMDAILLSPLDNVAVVVRRLPAGSRVKLEEGEVTLDRDLGLGHKIARRAIASGEKIVKYGVAIGSATCAIAPGQHVHLHNMQSDYLPTYTLETERIFRKAAIS
jgi:altronate dehydratase small subunit